MDIGTLLLYLAVAVGVIDIFVLLIGPRLKGYETGSFAMTFVGFFSSVGALVWLGYNIFTNNFTYEYIWQTTSVASDWALKLSALWAGQPGSLVFWTALSFILYFGFRLATRGYEDDTIVYRAYIIMAFESILIALNAIASDPFKLLEGTTPVDGLGLNPLLRTFWNVVHPPIIFIAYALALVPFAVRLAGFTVRTEDRNKDKIPVVESVVKLSTVTSWIMLSIGIALGGYWAYIVLGWGGYWAWDPVETSSLIPWLLLTGYYHASAVWRKNDVLRDSFLVFTYITVLFATWTTRSGVLTSVHGFTLSIVSWTMLATVAINFVLATIVTTVSGFIDIEDDDEDAVQPRTDDTEVVASNADQAEAVVTRFSSVGLRKLVLPTVITIAAVAGLLALQFVGIFSIELLGNLALYVFMGYLFVAALYVSMNDLRQDPIRIGLIGILLITAVSAAGIVVPAARNLFLTVFEPATELVAIDIIW
ncbi:MAG: cytochrome c biogenesis protein CcsA, partial [Candidatus Thorarchaeota archaeon]